MNKGYLKWLLILGVVIGLSSYVVLKQKIAIPTNTTVNKTPTSTPNAYLEIKGVSFTLPNGWKVEKIDHESNKLYGEETAYIRIPDPQYKAVLPMRIIKSSPAFPPDYTPPDDQGFVSQTPSGGKIYQPGCSGVYTCRYILYKGYVYDIRFEEVQTDGPQDPDETHANSLAPVIDDDVLLNFISTIK